MDPVDKVVIPEPVPMTIGDNRDPGPASEGPDEWSESVRLPRAIRGRLFDYFSSFEKCPLFL